MKLFSSRSSTIEFKSSSQLLLHDTHDVLAKIPPSNSTSMKCIARPTSIPDDIPDTGSTDSQHEKFSISLRGNFMNLDS